MIQFPSTACVGRVMPKEAFYRQLNLSKDLKEKFVSDIQRITMEYALTAESIHVDKSDELLEILVLGIQLKKQDFDGKIVESIAKQNKHKLVFVLSFEEKQQLALYSGKLYVTPWIPSAQMQLAIRGNTIAAIWEGLIEQIALTNKAPATSSLSIEQRLQRQEQIAKLNAQIERTERLKWKEKQPKKKFELHQKVLSLRQELAELQSNK